MVAESHALGSDGVTDVQFGGLRILHCLQRLFRARPG